MELRAEGSEIKTGGDLAGENITKTITHNNDGGMEALILAITSVERTVLSMDTRIEAIEKYNQTQGVQDMINKKFLTVGLIGALFLFMFVPVLSYITHSPPTSASVAVSPLNTVNHSASTPSLNPPQVKAISEWCLGAVMTVEEYEDMARRANAGENINTEVRCTGDKSTFSDWLAEVGAEGAPVLSFLINDGESPELVNNPILGVGFDCSGHNYGCSVLYFHANTLNLNQDFILSSMPSGWDNKISSYQKWTWHTAHLYEHNGLSGAVVSCGSCSSLGIMNNQGSSIHFQN